MSDPAPTPALRNTTLGAALLVLAAFVLNWPYLSGGFHADDLVFLEILQRDPLPFARWRGVWTVDDISAFDFWWAEAGAHAQFWRPLPSLIFEGSLRLFGENPFPLHLLSLLVHGGVAATLFLIVSRLTRETVLALVAGTIFVACEDHSLTVGWIATMTDLLCVLFLHVATLAHLTWLESRKRRWVLLSLVFVALGMASKESAVIIAPILVLASWALPEGRVLAPAKIAYGALGERTRRLLRDPWSWAPASALTGAYLAVYVGLKPAQMHNLMYVNPLTDPLGYFMHLVTHLPVVWLATLSPAPPSMTMFMPETLAPSAVVGVLAFGVWLAAMWSWRREPLVVWALGAYLLATLPQMGADASERLLYYPYTFAAVLLAMPVLRVGFVARRFAPDLEGAPRRIRWLGGYVLAVVLLPGVVLSAAMPFSFRKSLASPELHALTALPAIQRHEADRVLVLNTPGMFSTFYVAPVIDYHLARPVDVDLLSSCNALMTVERVGDRSFVIRADRPGWLSNMFARVVRVTPELTPGATYPQQDFSATVLEVTPDGTDALAVRFDLQPERKMLLMRWDGERFVPFDLDAMQTGKREVLADTSDVWTSMM